MSKVAIQVEHLSKRYRLGVISHRTLYREIQTWWAKVCGKRDPNSQILNDGIDCKVSSEDFWALHDVSLKVREGEILGIIGRNGAGKSTLLKILSRITCPTSGVVKIRGRMASLLEVGTGFHPELTGRENVFLNGAILGMSTREIKQKFDEIVDFSGVEQFIDTPVKRYSSGMHVRLAFAVAAHLDPEILLVDEVLAVGDVSFQKKCIGKMSEVVKGGRTILFVSHNMAAIKNLCDRTILLDKGQVLLDTITQKAVDTYLDQNLMEGSLITENEIEQKYEGRLNRINPSIRITEVSLLNNRGESTNQFFSDESIKVKVSYKCSHDIYNLRVTVQVVDDDNTPILSSQNWDDIEEHQFYNRKAGHYCSTCTIMPNLFGEKTLYISVNVVNLKFEHLVLNKILAFNVHFKGYHGIQSGNDCGILLRPHLKWDTKYLIGCE